jgi:hypothetical protein
MANITLRRPEAKRLPRRTVAGVLAAGLIGLLLLVEGIPGSIGAFEELPADDILQSLSDRKPITSSDLARAASDFKRAIAWLPSGEINQNLSLVLVTEAVQAGLRTDEGRRLLRDAQNAAIQDLRQRPISPNSWARLGYIQLQLDQSHEGVASALRMSLLTGWVNPDLTVTRLYLGYSAWKEFIGDEDLSMYLRFIREAWKQDPQVVVEQSRQYAGEQVTRMALAAIPPDLDRYNELLSQKAQPTARSN